MNNESIFSGIIQGDIVCFLRSDFYSQDYIDLVLTAYSEKWSRFDVSLQYKLGDEWFDDFNVISSSANRIDKNRLLGISASKYGYQNTIRWKLNSNIVLSNSDIPVRVNILPLIKNFTTSGTSNIVSELHAGNSAEIVGISHSNMAIGTNNKGQWISYNSGTLRVSDVIDGQPLFSMGGFNNPSCVYSMWNGNYVVADTGNNRVVEIDGELSTILKAIDVSDPSYVDYSESTETILITLRSSGRIEEYTWGDDYGSKIWQSNLVLTSPESATYNQKNLDLIVVGDTGNNRIAIINRLGNQFSYLNSFSIYDTIQAENEALNFYKPFRVFWKDDTIYVVEKNGKEVTFEILMSSSSSSSSSIDSSSSSNSSSTSFSSKSSRSTSSSSTSISSQSSVSSSSTSIDSLSSLSSKSVSSDSSGSTISTSSTSSSSSIDSSSSSSEDDMYLEVYGSSTPSLNRHYLWDGTFVNGAKRFVSENNNWIEFIPYKGGWTLIDNVANELGVWYSSPDIFPSGGCSDFIDLPTTGPDIAITYRHRYDSSMTISESSPSSFSESSSSSSVVTSSSSSIDSHSSQSESSTSLRFQSSSSTSLDDVYLLVSGSPTEKYNGEYAWDRNPYDGSKVFVKQGDVTLKIQKDYGYVWVLYDAMSYKAEWYSEDRGAPTGYGYTYFDPELEGIRIDVQDGMFPTSTSSSSSSSIDSSSSSSIDSSSSSIDSSSSSSIDSSSSSSIDSSSSSSADLYLEVSGATSYYSWIADGINGNYLWDGNYSAGQKNFVKPPLATLVFNESLVQWELTWDGTIYGIWNGTAVPSGPASVYPYPGYYGVEGITVTPI